MWLLMCKAPDYRQLPARVYWNAERRAWGRFDQATRFGTADKWPQPAPHWPGAETSWVPDWPVDLDGFPYSTGELPWRLTHCCGAGASISDGPLYCKSCYAAVELAYDTPPRLDANWQPGDGPIRIELGGGETAAGPSSPSRSTPSSGSRPASPGPSTADQADPGNPAQRDGAARPPGSAPGRAGYRQGPDADRRGAADHPDDRRAP